MSNSSKSRDLGLAQKLNQIIHKDKPRSVTRLGEVKSINGNTYNVLLDGDSDPVPIRAAHEAKVGQRVIVLTETTNWAVIGAYL